MTITSKDLIRFALYLVVAMSSSLVGYYAGQSNAIVMEPPRCSVDSSKAMYDVFREHMLMDFVSVCSQLGAAAEPSGTRAL